MQFCRNIVCEIEVEFALYVRHGILLLQISLSFSSNAGFEWTLVSDGPPETLGRTTTVARAAIR